MTFKSTLIRTCLVAAFFLGALPGLAQQETSGSDQDPKADDPVSNSDTVTLHPEMMIPEDKPKRPATAAPKPDQRKRTVVRSSSDMQSAPKVSADDVLKQFERDRPKARPLLPRSGADRTIVREPLSDGDLRRSPARLPEGYFLVDRAGRVTKEGPWFVFNFIGDNNPAATPDPPMRLLPNRMLERMIRESKGSTTSVEFIVSGEVTDFMGENHLLLRKLLRKRSVGNLSN